jgi:RNA polymerase-interacting CarD/CdnL/TRCF family regulator
LGGDEAILARLPKPGEPVFYPKVGHCVFRGVILVPLSRVPALNLRPAGMAMEAVQEELSAQFEGAIPEDADRHRVIEELIAEGSPRSLARALKRLHFLRQTTGLAREEEQTRKKIRSWLAAEVAIGKQCTRAEAQAFMTRVLQDAMSAHKLKEKEEAKERRRAAKEQKKSDAVPPVSAVHTATPDGHEGPESEEDSPVS